ncbi:MAG: metallophosphoesterase [Bryobacterales bacterium]|nr:metallophosphoesterase [Bryobacterales bacterium]
MSGVLFRYTPDLLFLAVVLTMHAVAWRRVSKGWKRAGLAVSAVWVFLSILTNVHQLANALPPGEWLSWVRGTGQMYGLCLSGMLALWMLVPKPEARFAPQRRQLLLAARSGVVAAPALITGYGVFSGRTQFHIKEVNLSFAGLPKDLDGLRILQLSDIHMSPFLDEAEVARVIDMANETKPHVAVLTGDLITGPHDPLEACIAQVGRLKADHGVLGCHGNHEIFARVEDRAQALAARRGIRILRQEAASLRFGDARMNLVGVDYQNFRRPYLTGMDRLVEPGQFNVLLSHNPDVFPVAAGQGYDLTLAGHTHGGQVTFEILHQYANVARIFTPYVCGEYRKENRAIYVTRGIGTVGIPARVGAPPEITLIRLCAS